MPLDATKANSRAVSFSLGADIKMKQIAEIKTKFDKLKQVLILSQVMSQITDAKAFVNDLTMVMINRHLNKVLEKETSEDLLLPSSICIRYDQIIEPEKESDISNLLVNFEPLELKLGYRELDNFKGISEVFSNILEGYDTEGWDAQDMQYDTLEDKRMELILIEDRMNRQRYGESKKIREFRQRK